MLEERTDDDSRVELEVAPERILELLRSLLARSIEFILSDLKEELLFTLELRELVEVRELLYAEPVRPPVLSSRP